MDAILHESPPGLIVKFLPDVALPYTDHPPGPEDRPWHDFLSWTHAHGATVRPCFPLLAERLRTASGADPEDDMTRPAIDRFWSVVLPDASPALRELLAEVSTLPGVESVSVTPPGGPPPYTPDHTSRQTYLDVGDHHVGATYAWRTAGGAGKAVKVCVCDDGFRTRHEDLPVVTIVTGEAPDLKGLVGSGQYEHGTSVIGLIAAMQDSKGVTGIAYDVAVHFACVDDSNRYMTVDKGLNSLSAGDVLVLEMQALASIGNASVAVPQEYDDAIRAALQAAAFLGIVVVEAAGNGRADLATVPFLRAYNGQPVTGYAWKKGDNFYDDSRAIIVGAGHAPDQTRVYDSNWGDRVNCQGWGESIVTTGSVGYGSDLPDSNGNPPADDAKYTTAFGATSGATAMVAGVVACMQGVRLGAGTSALLPKRVRKLVSTKKLGTRQPTQDEAMAHIGPLPNLEKLRRRVTQIP